MTRQTHSLRECIHALGDALADPKSPNSCSRCAGWPRLAERHRALIENLEPVRMPDRPFMHIVESRLPESVRSALATPVSMPEPDKVFAAVRDRLVEAPASVETAMSALRESVPAPDWLDTRVQAAVLRARSGVGVGRRWAFAAAALLMATLPFVAYSFSGSGLPETDGTGPTARLVFLDVDQPLDAFSPSRGSIDNTRSFFRLLYSSRFVAVLFPCL